MSISQCNKTGQKGQSSKCSSTALSVLVPMLELLFFVLRIGCSSIRRSPSHALVVQGGKASFLFFSDG